MKSLSLLIVLLATWTVAYGRQTPASNAPKTQQGVSAPAAKTAAPTHSTTPPSASTADKARESELDEIMDMSEAAGQLRALEAFLKKYPDAAEASDVYDAMIKDAAALNDDHLILQLNEELQARDPADIGQRIRTLNLLMLETDATSRTRAQQYASELARIVEAKSKEDPPEGMGQQRWHLTIAHMRSLALMFEGAAAQEMGEWTSAEGYFNSSLVQAQSEEAAEHLAEVYTAEKELPQALDAYALALALPGQTISERLAMRQKAGALYRSLHAGSDNGFGDLVMHAFDEVATRDAMESKQLDPLGGNPDARTLDDFVLHSLDGTRHSLGEHHGKVLVVDFWATWCGPCLTLHALLQEVAQKYQTNRNVAFLAINEDEDEQKVKPFIDSQNWDPNTLLDAGLGGFLGVDSLPTTLVLDGHGTVVFRQEGLTPGVFAQELETAIGRALATHSQ